jgi:hypothetical protein
MNELKQLRKHLTVANVLSCIALFLALGGAAYAAKTAAKVKTQNLANGAVTTPKLRNGAVTTAKLRNGGVTGQKIAPATIGSGQLANGSVRSGQLGGGVVTEAKIKAGAVSSSKLAPNFLTQLVRNVSYANAESAMDSEGAKTVTALCPAGKEAIAGGARVNGELEEVAVTGSNPFVAADGTRTGWSAFGRELPDEPGAKKWSITAFAVCAEL